MSISRRLVGISALVTIVMILVGGMYLRIRDIGGAAGDGAVVSAEEDRPEVSASSTFSTNVAIPVEGGMVVRDTLVVSVSAAAQAVAIKQAALSAQVQGRIVRLHVMENAVVEGGRLLIEIEGIGGQVEQSSRHHRVGQRAGRHAGSFDGLLGKAVTSQPGVFILSDGDRRVQ